MSTPSTAATMVAETAPEWIVPAADEYLVDDVDSPSRASRSWAASSSSRAAASVSSSRAFSTSDSSSQR